MLAAPGIARRVDEVSWVADYIDDLEADFLAVYHVPDDPDGRSGMWSLPGPRWLRLASRTVAYPGVVAARAEALRVAPVTAPQPAPEVPQVAPGRTMLPDGSEVREVAGTRSALAADPMLSRLIEMG